MEKAIHRAHPGRQCRSVSFDEGKRSVIATDLDPEVDPRNLKPIVGRVPTPRPSKTECIAQEADDSCESSRPHSSSSQGGFSPASTKQGTLKPEMLVMRLTVDCEPPLNAADPVLRERGEGVQLPDSPRCPEKQDVLDEDDNFVAD